MCATHSNVISISSGSTDEENNIWIGLWICDMISSWNHNRANVFSEQPIYSSTLLIWLKVCVCLCVCWGGGVDSYWYMCYNVCFVSKWTLCILYKVLAVWLRLISIFLQTAQWLTDCISCGGVVYVVKYSLAACILKI